MKNSRKYTGRFAPSPTGFLHQGSLVAAMASYLDARANQGKWLIRMEDIDQPRVRKGSAKSILETLSGLGFEWDDKIIYQSNRLDIYQDYLNKLTDEQQVYACRCSRKQLASHSVYPGICRNRQLSLDTPSTAIRLKTQSQIIGFDDRILGKQQQDVHHDAGDFIIKRKDGLFAYQLVVVIDDALQNITHVVRGEDLLSSTFRHILLQQQLAFPTPDYAHIPLVYDKNGRKISKSQEPAKKLSTKLDNLVQAWKHLQTTGVKTSDFDSLADFWDWAIRSWDIKQINRQVPT